MACPALSEADKCEKVHVLPLIFENISRSTYRNLNRSSVSLKLSNTQPAALLALTSNTIN